MVSNSCYQQHEKLVQYLQQAMDISPADIVSEDPDRKLLLDYLIPRVNDEVIKSDQNQLEHIRQLIVLLLSLYCDFAQSPDAALERTGLNQEWLELAINYINNIQSPSTRNVIVRELREKHPDLIDEELLVEEEQKMLPLNLNAYMDQETARINAEVAQKINNMTRSLKLNLKMQQGITEELKSIQDDDDNREEKLVQLASKLEKLATVFNMAVNKCFSFKDKGIALDIFNAVEQGNLDPVLELFEAGVDIFTMVHPRTGDTLFHIIARHGIMSNCDRLLEVYFCSEGDDIGLFSKINARGETILHCAAENADNGCTQSLIAFCSELLTKKDNEGNTAFYRGVKTSNWYSVKVMLDLFSSWTEDAVDDTTRNIFDEANHDGKSFLSYLVNEIKHAHTKQITSRRKSLEEILLLTLKSKYLLHGSRNSDVVAPLFPGKYANLGARLQHMFDQQLLAEVSVVGDELSEKQNILLMDDLPVAVGQGPSRELSNEDQLELKCEHESESEPESDEDVEAIAKALLPASVVANAVQHVAAVKTAPAVAAQAVDSSDNRKSINQDSVQGARSRNQSKRGSGRGHGKKRLSTQRGRRGQRNNTPADNIVKPCTVIVSQNSEAATNRILGLSGLLRHTNSSHVQLGQKQDSKLPASVVYPESDHVPETDAVSEVTTELQQASPSSSASTTEADTASQDSAASNYQENQVNPWSPAQKKLMSFDELVDAKRRFVNACKKFHDYNRSDSSGIHYQKLVELLELTDNDFHAEDIMSRFRVKVAWQKAFDQSGDDGSYKIVSQYYPSDIFTVNAQGLSVMHLAVINGDYDDFMFLLENKSELLNQSSQSSPGVFPIHLVCKHGREAMLSQLLSKLDEASARSMVNITDWNGETPLQKLKNVDDDEVKMRMTEMLDQAGALNKRPAISTLRKPTGQAAPNTSTINGHAQINR